MVSDNMRRLLVGVAGIFCFTAVQCSELPTVGPGVDGGGASQGSGKLRLLITDKPFPFEFIESALVTITRVEVRREDDGDDGEISCDISACDDGACQTTERECDDEDACTIDTCDAATGACSYEDIVCDETERCVEGECRLLCEDDEACDDGSLCTTDTCVDGACSNVEKSCADDDLCTDDACDPDTGDCTNDALSCADGEACDEGECRRLCSEDEDCDDENLCTDDSCSEGLCANDLRTCEDDDACTIDACDEASGDCTNVSFECEDGQACVDGGCAQACEQDADCESSSDDEGDDDDDSSWLVIFEGERAFDLVDLRNGRTDLLADAEIPAGTYTETRLIVTAGEVTLTDGRVFPLKVPSGAQSGIKLKFTFTIEDGGTTELLLDVDLSRAFKAIPGGRIDEVDGIREFKFSPSVAMRLIELVDAGEIAGTVSDTEGDPIANAAVTALLGGEEVTSTATEEDGTYRLIGLLAGDYTVEFSAAGFADQQVEDVAVTAGAATEGVDATLEAEALDP